MLGKSLTVDAYGRIVAKADVVEPGKRGGKFYRTERTGKVQYGEQPPALRSPMPGDIQHDHGAPDRYATDEDRDAIARTCPRCRQMFGRLFPQATAAQIERAAHLRRMPR